MTVEMRQSMSWPTFMSRPTIYINMEAANMI